MGCDIHAYIERVKSGVGRDGTPWVNSLGRIYPGRNYWFFAIMAGVRDHGEVPILFTPRGLPEHLGWEVESEDRIYVREDGDTEGSEYSVERSKAEEWVGRGFSHWVGEKKQWVSNPDHHSHSWLTSKELKQVLAAYEEKETAPVEWKALFAFVQALGEGGRLVFWFDN